MPPRCTSSYVIRFAILQPVRTEHARLIRRIHGDRGGFCRFSDRQWIPSPAPYSNTITYVLKTTSSLWNMNPIKPIAPPDAQYAVRICAILGRDKENMYIYDRCPSASSASVRVASSVNRDLDDLSFRGPHTDRRFHQVIELGSDKFTNTVTSVQKDNLLWIEHFL